MACIVVGAGTGTRLGAGAPKAFVRVGGATLLEHAVGRVLACGSVGRVVAVVPPSLVEEAAGLLPGDVVVTAGGADRQESVAAGLRALAGQAEVDVVLVHDAARCLAPAAVLARVVLAVRAGNPVVVPAVPVHDTVRALADDGASSVVDRSALRAVQTPQGFTREVLERAHATAGPPGATDDAALAERLGHVVHVVDGAPEAFKVTGPLDLALAEVLLARGPA